MKDIVIEDTVSF